VEAPPIGNQKKESKKITDRAFGCKEKEAENKGKGVDH